MFIISRNCSAHDFAAKGKNVLSIRELQRFKFFQSQQNIVKAYNSEICTAEFRCGTAKNRIFGFFRFDEQFIIAGSCGNFFQDVEFFCDGTGFNDSAVFTAECRGAAPAVILRSCLFLSSLPNAVLRVLSISSISLSAHSSIVFSVESKYVSFPTLIRRSFF